MSGAGDGLLLQLAEALCNDNDTDRVQGATTCPVLHAKSVTWQRPAAVNAHNCFASNWLMPVSLRRMQAPYRL